MTTNPPFTARLYAGEADLQPSCDLINRCAAVDGVDIPYETPAQMRGDFAGAEFDTGRDLCLWEDAAGRLAGYGCIWIPQDESADGVIYCGTRVFAAPEARGQGLETAIIAWAGARGHTVAQERRRPVRLRSYFNEGLPEYNAYRQGMLEAHGFVPIRYGFKMARDLRRPIAAPELPPGFVLRPTRGAAEAAEWAACDNEAFAGYWHSNPITTEDVLRHQQAPDYIPECDLVVIAPDDTLAACCICLIDHDDNAHHNYRRGDVASIATRPAWQRRGLGRALLLAGLHALRAQGMDMATLGVDAANATGALRLYESVGFTQVRRNIAYCKDV